MKTSERQFHEPVKLTKIVKIICKYIYKTQGPLKTKQKRERIIQILQEKGYPIPSKEKLKKMAYLK